MNPYYFDQVSLLFSLMNKVVQSPEIALKGRESVKKLEKKLSEEYALSY